MTKGIGEDVAAVFGVDVHDSREILRLDVLYGDLYTSIT